MSVFVLWPLPPKGEWAESAGRGGALGKRPRAGLEAVVPRARPCQVTGAEHGDARGFLDFLREVQTGGKQVSSSCVPALKSETAVSWEGGLDLQSWRTVPFPRRITLSRSRHLGLSEHLRALQDFSYLESSSADDCETVPQSSRKSDWKCKATDFVDV